MTAVVRQLAILAALVASLLMTPGIDSAGASHPSPVQTYCYDDHRRPPVVLADPSPGRGPPAVDRTTTAYDADGRRPLGASSRHRISTAICTYSTYDWPAQFAHGDRASATTQMGSGGHLADVCVVPGARCAANTGPRMLGVGPWGQRVVDARTKLPGSWGPGVPNKKGVGTRWFDPSNPGNGVRIDRGLPGSPQLSQQVDHVVVRSGGKVIGPDGKPIVGSLSDNPQAHIPLTDWMSWSSWSAP